MKKNKILTPDEKLIKENIFLKKQCAELRELAERAGSEKAKFEHKSIRLEEENKKLVQEIDFLRQKKCR